MPYRNFELGALLIQRRFGRSASAQISFATRSGTQIFHGSAFDYLRNDFFDANDWFNNHYGAPTPALRQTISKGPSAALSGYHIWSTVTSVTPFSFSTTRAFGSPSRKRPIFNMYLQWRSARAQPKICKPILNVFLLPTGSEITDANGNLTGLSPFVAAYSLPSQIDSVGVRTDWMIAPRLSLFFRFSNAPSSSSSRSLSSIIQTRLNTRTYTLGANYQISANSTNQFRDMLPEQPKLRKR